jgi:hypothetical protein
MLEQYVSEKIITCHSLICHTLLKKQKVPQKLCIVNRWHPNSLDWQRKLSQCSSCQSFTKDPVLWLHQTICPSPNATHSLLLFPCTYSFLLLGIAMGVRGHGGIHGRTQGFLLSEHTQEWEAGTLELQAGRATLLIEKGWVERHTAASGKRVPPEL